MSTANPRPAALYACLVTGDAHSQPAQGAVLAAVTNTHDAHMDLAHRQQAATAYHQAMDDRSKTIYAYQEALHQLLLCGCTVADDTLALLHPEQLGGIAAMPAADARPQHLQAPAQPVQVKEPFALITYLGAACLPRPWTDIGMSQPAGVVHTGLP